MTGGTIFENQGTHLGGGVSVSGGAFIMESGTISGNTANYGGGVYVSIGTFEMKGGTISGNSANYGGGGVYVDFYAWFIMNGGVISGNTAEKRGGGVCIGEGGFEMTGGTVSGNTAEIGGGVYFSYAPEDDEESGESLSYSLGDTLGMFISGAPKITGNKAKDGSANNLYLQDATVTVAGELAEGAQIGIYTDLTIAVVTGFTQEVPSAYFTSDNPEFDCIYISDKESGTVKIGTHEMSDGWINDENSHWHECINGCGLKTDEAEHGLNDGVTTQPTCTENGKKVYTCQVCGETKTEVISATDHNWNDGEITTAPTCTVGSEKTFTCANDASHTKTEEIPALGHDVIRHEAQEATCTEGGWEEYETCSRCDYSTKVEIPALGHDVIRHEAQEATCTEGGWEEYETCSRCDYSTKVEIPAHGHDFEDEFTIDKEATCTEEGLKSRHCKNCDEVTDVTVIAVVPHSLTHVPEAPATTDADGNTEYWECDECHKYFSDAEGKTEITDKSSVIIVKIADNGSVIWLILLIILCVIIAGETAFIIYRKTRKTDGKEKKL